MTIAEMQKRLDDLNNEAIAIQALADTETRDLTVEEKQTIQQTLDSFEDLEEQVKQRKRLEAQTLRLKNPPDPTAADDDVSTRATASVAPGRPPRTVPAEPRINDRSFGWPSLGHFIQGVRSASVQGGKIDNRIIAQRAALSTFGNEAVGAEGGFAVTPQHLDRIIEKVTEVSLLLPLCDRMTIERNSMTLPKDETTPWGSAGPQGNWTGEGAAITQSKPDLKTNTLKLHKLASLVPLTEELMEDATALESYIIRRIGMVFAHLVDLAIYQGSGSGRPQGILTGTGTVSIAKEGSQTADTVLGQNVLKMWSRLYAPWRTNAVWLFNQDVEPQLSQMYIVDQESTPVSSWPVYLPAGGFAGMQFATLFGRPVHFTQVCETLGDKGDSMLADFAQYMILEKAGGMKTSTSIHFWFDQDALALKVVMRVAGQPMFDDTIAARDGSTVYSAFVTLDERA